MGAQTLEIRTFHDVQVSESLKKQILIYLISHKTMF